MQFVPVKKPESGRGVRRAVILFFASILALGMFAATTSSAAGHGPALLRVKNTTVTEGNAGTTTAYVKILLNHRTNHRVSVGWATADGSATAGSDYVAASGRAKIPRGHKVAFARVSIIGDTTHESNEYFKVRLFHPHGARIVDGVAFVEILDNDVTPPTQPTLNVADAKVVEGGVLHFKVSLTKATSGPVTFDFATADNTATAASGDYTAKSGNDVVIPQGQTSTIVTVQTLDNADTTDETMFLNISDVHGAVAGDLHAVGTIVDDDALAVLSVHSLGAVKEGGVSHFRVSLSKAVSGPVTFHYATADHTAVAPGDYTAIPDTVRTIAAGNTSVVIVVQTNDPAPDVAEPTESFFFKISNPTGATLGDSVALGVIEDD